MRSERESRASDLVRYSRAGDAFHHRWAARRCLRMIDPRCLVQAITIEASKHSKLAGECAIDVAEYSESADEQKGTAYYQLKHSTVRVNRKLGLNDLTKTLKAFAQRYAAHAAKNGTELIRFSLVTNRRLDPKLAAVFDAIRFGTTISTARRRRLEKATKLSGESLRSFFTSFTVVDGEGDYVVQHEQLHGELAGYLAGFVDSTEVDKIVNLVSQRALPQPVKNRRKGEILREDVLQRLNVTSPRHLFPAPREFETLPQVIRREQHDALMQHVLYSTAPTIIHAAGGVGKSVVARQIADSLPKGSLGLVYDCFGSGKYRNPSEPRHRPTDALVQMANELAAAGYCRTLIAPAGVPADALFRSFLDRLQEAVRSLREIQPDALLVLLIDAADNAEMAAQENSDQCFAHGLLREPLPTGCRLVALCRTERRHLLKPQSTVHQLPLEPFSERETAAHLRTTFATATDDDVREFHRLTGGNPRVQANALGTGRPMEEMLASLGPAVTTVAAQINAQLQAAVATVKDRSTADVSQQVDAICLGLANLPPFIPVAVLAKAAQVEESTIHSFVSDLGRPLWHSDRSVQFRDEPTETWFREQFAASAEQIQRYVAQLEPLAKDYPYVAKALPQLLLTSGNHARLIELALSDDFLPENSIDARNIRVYRLQFAFRAALRLGRLADAAQLAFRAGEEVAGDERQLRLLRENADLVTPLLDPTRVQELAYRQLLRGAWQGSENVYSASLLSSVSDFKGEARGYRRAADKWLRIFFEERAKREPHDQFGEQLEDDDIAEMAWADFNLRGTLGLVDSLRRWRPSEVTLRLTRQVVRRLVDAARFDEIDELALQGHKNPQLILGLTDALESVARFPPATSLKPTLTVLVRNALKKPEGHFHNDFTTPAIISFCEACAARGLAKTKIASALDHYTEARACRSIGSDHQEAGRTLFLRGVALRAVLAGGPEPDPKTLLPPPDPHPHSRSRDESDERNLLQVLGGLLPWFHLRARLIARDPAAAMVDLEKVRATAKSALMSRYRTHDPIPYEISAIRFSVLALRSTVTTQELDHFNQNVLGRAREKFSLKDRLWALHTACRVAHLAPLRSLLEQSCAAAIDPASTEGPEERAGDFLRLARAVLAVNSADASAYFERAIEAVSKFGEEMVPRWQAVVAMGRRAADGSRVPDESAYRFFKCAEMVGESVAREKHWSRSEVFRTGVRLHGPAAFAAMSRWRDREVSWFDRPMLALAIEAVSSGQVAPMPAWCLTGFLACNAEAEFAVACIKCEPNPANRQHLFDSSVRDLELKGGERESWLKLQAVAEEFTLDQARLMPLLAIHAPPQTPAPSAEVPRPSYRQQLTPADWDTVFSGIDFMTSVGIARAEENYRATKPPFEFEDFWAELLRRVPAGREVEFLETVRSVESLSSYDISYLLVALRQHWLAKASIKTAWPRFLAAVGQRYAATLAETGHLSYWVDRGSLAAEDVPHVKTGLMRGLAESLDLVDARTFFGFVVHIASELSPVEAAKLLGYAMGRFELHIDAEFGDGPWAEWLKSPSGMSEAVAGLIWSALGSPLSAIRWQAAHAVRRLVEVDCQAEIDALFDWLRRDAVGAFGSHRFPFYRLHARLYLLIALARAACDRPDRLRRHAPMLAQLALEGMPHILIQKTAADVALAIERAQPGTYPADTAYALGAVGRSSFPPKEVEGYPKDDDSPWHTRGEVDKTLKLHFGMDFDEYWFNYLGDVFGISKQQAIELGREAAVAHLGVANTDDYQPDPRERLWESRDYYDRGTSYSHSSYPTNDDYRFYYSYHSFMSLAARLLGAIPVIHRKDGFREDQWNDWLRRHGLTRADGLWLADRRDPSPVKRRAWTAHSGETNWRWGIGADDFLDVLLHQSPRDGWLCVGGHWSECFTDQTESVQVDSAFVALETANALAASLRWCRSPHDFRLPHYNEEEEQFGKSPFGLIGWIHREDSGDKRLDGFDPYAREISYPPYQPGASFLTQLGLVSDGEKRAWCQPGAVTPTFISELWSENTMSERDRPYREGARICASVGELRRLCGLLKQELIFSVKMDRRMHRHRGDSSRDFGYLPASHKIFILSANGQLRDARQSHQVG